MYKPNLFLVGAAKSGTSTLYDYFISHKEVYCSNSLKEPRFFSYPYFLKMGAHREILERAVKTEEEYLTLYRKRNKEKYILDGSVYYLYFDGIPERISAFNPGAKIIICIRNPADRFISHYNMHLRDTGEDVDFESFLKHPFSREGLSLLDLGCYCRQVKNYFDVFGRNNVHIVLFEHIVKDFDKATEDICSFLSIQHVRARARKINTSGRPKNKAYRYFSQYFYRRFPLQLKKKLPVKFTAGLKAKLDGMFLEKTDIEMDQRNKLVEYYTEDIRQLEELLDMDLKGWY